MQTHKEKIEKLTDNTPAPWSLISQSYNKPPLSNGLSHGFDTQSLLHTSYTPFVKFDTVEFQVKLLEQSKSLGHS